MSRILDYLGQRILAWLETRRVDFYKRKMNTGHSVRIKPGLVVKRPKNVHLGNNVRINTNCLLQAHAPIYIGDLTMIATNCTIVTASHDMEARGIEAFDTVTYKEVRIGGNCWLGAGVIVLPGVTIGDGVVVGAGSVVTRDLPDETICMGSPAKPVRKRPTKFHANPPQI